MIQQTYSANKGSFSSEHEKIPANQVGDNGLVNGQWFPNFVAALRDGAHGNAYAGIHGRKNHGAFSVVVAGAYHDIDDGETVGYCGVQG